MTSIMKKAVAKVHVGHLHSCLDWFINQLWSYALHRMFWGCLQGNSEGNSLQDALVSKRKHKSHRVVLHACYILWLEGRCTYLCKTSHPLHIHCYKSRCNSPDCCGKLHCHDSYGCLWNTHPHLQLTSHNKWKILTEHVTAEFSMHKINRIGKKGFVSHSHIANYMWSFAFVTCRRAHHEQYSTLTSD